MVCMVQIDAHALGLRTSMYVKQYAAQDRLVCSTHRGWHAARFRSTRLCMQAQLKEDGHAGGPHRWCSGRPATFSISTAAGRCDRSHGPAFWADRRARRRGASRADVRSMRAHWAGLTCGAGQDRTRRLRATSRALVPVCGLGRRKIRLDIKALTAISRVRIRACHVHTPAARCARRQGHRATTCLPTAATTIEEAQPARV